MNVRFVQRKTDRQTFRAERLAVYISSVEYNKWLLTNIRSRTEHVVTWDLLQRDYDDYPMLLSVDFDGTIAELVEFPNIGYPVELAFQTLYELRDLGHRLLLNTCRTAEGLDKVKAWMDHHRVLHLFEKFNENADDVVAHWNINCRKIYADLYLGDDAFNWQGWEPVRRWFGLPNA